jgi:hypothetical protein
MQSNLASFGATQSNSGSSSNPMQKDMDQLGQLIEAGDLSGAQTLFKTMQEKMNAHGPASSQTSTSSDSGNDIGTLFSAVGSALESGDATSAQTAWSNLQDKLQSMPPPPPPDGQQKNQTQSSSSSSSSSSSTVSQLEALLVSLSWQTGSSTPSSAS